MKIFISDLHLGRGDELEDFLLWNAMAELSKTRARLEQPMELMHRAFAGFVRHILDQCAGRGRATPELVLLGDIFDLLQVLPERRNDPRKISLIMKAHAPFFSALDSFLEGGGAVTLILGNHDYDLIHPRLHDALKRRIPRLNERHGGGPLLFYHDPESGIYAEHGNQFDALNAWRNPGDPGEWPFGSELVLRLVNPLEKTFPILDNLGIREALWFALRRLPEPAGPLHRRDLLLADALTGITREERLKHLAWFLLHRLCPTHQASFFHMLWRLLVQNEEDLRSGSANRRAFRGLLFTFRTLGRNPLRIFQEMLGDRQTAAAKGILGGDVSHTIGRPGPVPRHVLFGHTHRPRLVRLAGGRSYANTGSWRMRILPRGRASFRVEQSLDYVRAMPGNGGGWRLIPGCWADEWPLQADPAGHS